MSKLRRPSPPMIVALLALFVALGGTGAYAISGHNTVDSGDIINGQVKPQDLSAKTAGQAYGRYHDDYGEVPDGQFAEPPQAGADDVLNMNLPAGSYLVLGKLQVRATGAGAFVNCRVYAEGDFDSVFTGYNGGGAIDPIANNLPMTMTVLHSAANAFTAHLSCADGGNDGSYARAKLIAIRLASIHNQPG